MSDLAGVATLLSCKSHKGLSREKRITNELSIANKGKKVTNTKFLKTPTKKKSNW